MAKPLSRRIHVLPQNRPQAQRYGLTTIGGGRSGNRMALRRELSRQTHSREERALLALCAAAVLGTLAIVVFAAVRDRTFLEQSVPVAPLVDR